MMRLVPFTALFLVFTIAAPNSMLAQTSNDSVYVTADQMPVFDEGEDSLFAFIKAYAHNPANAVENETEGRVIVSAIINKDGWVEQPAIYKSVAWPLDSTALHVVRMMPPWIPGIRNKNPVSVKVFIPVTFKIDKSPFVYTYAEQMPTTGYDKSDFFATKIQYPDALREKGIQGKVIVKFTVDEEGNVTDPVAVRSTNALLSKEAVRVVSLMPKWTPGKQNGKAVKVYFTLPIVFSLEDDYTVSVDDILKSKDKKEKHKESDLYYTGQREPAFPLLNMYISYTMKYPEIAMQNNVEGTVIVSFIVDKEGKLQYPSIEKSVAPALDSEALRIVKGMPKWQPAIENGEKVSKKYSLPIKFDINAYKAAQKPQDSREVMPSAGFDINAFLEEHIEYPESAINRSAQGTVYVKFVINEDGHISDPQVKNPVDPSLDAEAVRVISIMPKWNPGIQNGKAVKVYFTLPVKFVLRH